MFERFTDRARKVMELANQKAQQFNHKYIGTEHILMALVIEGSGVGATVLKNLDVDIKKLRLDVEKQIKPGPDKVSMGKLPQSPRAMKVTEYAIEEARSLNHHYVGTEHILLGLLQEGGGIAAQTLMNIGLKLEDVRQEVLNLLGKGMDDGPASISIKMDSAVGQKPKSKKGAVLFEKYYGLLAPAPVKIIKEAISLAQAELGEKGPLTMSCLLFSFFDLGRSESVQLNTARFFLERIKQKITQNTITPVRMQYFKAASEGLYEWDLIQTRECGNITTFVVDVLKLASEYAISTTNKSKIHVRHLFAALLLFNYLEGNSGVSGRLRELGITTEWVLETFPDHLKKFKNDDQKNWTKILAEGLGKLSEMSADEFYVADGKTQKDRLGFMPYVKAVAAFLTHVRTQPPLTMSVEGEWGSGKSSFMLQLQDEIERIYAEQDKGKCFIVEFDPWRYDKDEELWAAFALGFIRQVSRKLGLLKRLYANMSLKLTQYNWREGWIDVVKVVGLLIVWLVVTGVLVTLVYKGVTLDKEGNIKLPGWIGSTAVIAGALFVALGKVKDFVGSPLEVHLKKYMKQIDYVSKIGFIEKFHKDFKKIIQSYVGDRRVYVFIDDLDRCRVPKAAELMESINLMISEEPNLMFIMGMDREKVAAGLAVKHEKLLPYLSSQVEVESGLENNNKRRSGVRYGYSFIEKFIQVPFMLPIPRQGWIEEMLLDLAGQRSDIDKELKFRKKTIWSPISGMLSKLGFLMPSVLKTFFLYVLKKLPKSRTIVVKKKRPMTKGEKEEQIVTEKVDAAVKKVFGDDENFRHIVQMVSPHIKYNPRRVKQFVNLFRLRYVTAMSTNLFELEDGKRLTFEQLGKFVGIGLGWPLFIRDLERNPGLLDKLVDVAEGKNPQKDKKIKEWAGEEKLIGLIKSGCFDENEKKKTGGEYERFSMRGLDVEKLMKVAPRVEQM